MKITPIDQFMTVRVQPQHREIVETLRKIMREIAPQAREVITYGILGWRGNLMLAMISPTKKDITLAFSKGAEFEDKEGLLKGVGKVSKHLKFKSAQEIDRNVIMNFMQQALKLDAK